MNKEDHKKLLGIFKSNDFEPYVRHIRFTKYKNISENLKIDFLFPITAIVGTNGTNKSSILKALFSCCQGNSLSDLWLSTRIDKISVEPGIIHGYKDASLKKIVENLYKKINKKGETEDYWETARPQVGLGMIKPPDSYGKLRFDKINKKSVYLTFRDSISAFDKMYYYGDVNNMNLEINQRKQLIRRYSHRLSSTITTKKTSDVYRTVQRVVNSENYTLSQDQLDWVKKIIGVNYSSIQMIHHRYFKCDGYTCILYKNGINYSEAMAGSGEFSVVQLVVKITNAENKSIILLDEPEVSLHPGAQKKLIDFLTWSVIQKKHQIIIATHSPSIIRELPREAIKSLSFDANGNITLLSQECSPNEAFLSVGEPISNKIIIYLEDKLACEIVKRAIKNESPSFKDLFSINYLPGGAQTIWSNFVINSALTKSNNIFFIFDPDQNFYTPEKSEHIPEIENIKLKEKIDKMAGFNLKIPIDSGIQPFSDQRSVIDWCINHVKYLPGANKETPEQLVWENMTPSDQTRSIQDNLDYKSRFEQLAMLCYDQDSVNSDEIFIKQKEQLATITPEAAFLSKIKDILCEISASIDLS